ncbi:MAG: 2-C-methyl-D-erythritol 4-phosphate cytidylyltransferase [Bacteroidota bacterium]
MSELKRYVIITAGGAGLRMQNSTPKQFLLLGGKPILFHTIETFFRFDSCIRVILVLPARYEELWDQITQQYEFSVPVKKVTGGPTRFHSVKNGLKLVDDQSLVAIHDGVRPLVSQKTISEAFRMASFYGNAIPVISMNESVRWVENAFNKPINRDQVKIVQTPQCFRANMIKKAYDVQFHEAFTDDASVLEKAGERIYLSEGNTENIKITSPGDLFLAEALLQHKKQTG